MNKYFNLGLETVKILISKLELMKSNTNKIRLEIGCDNEGTGLSSKAIIVNGMQMEEVGFTTEGVPADYVEKELYVNCAVKASEFIAYLSAFSVFNSVITFCHTGSVLKIEVPGQADISLPTVNLAEAEPLFEDDSKNSLAIIKCESAKFIEVLKASAYNAENVVDPSGINDRVVFMFEPDKVTVFSSEGHIFASSWCNLTAKFNNKLRALSALREKGSSLDDAGKAMLFTKIKEVEQDKENGVQKLLGLAKTEAGFEENVCMLALPTVNANVLLRVISNSEYMQVIITTRYFKVLAGNTLATFMLADRYTSMYRKMTAAWEQTKWNGKIVVDRDQLLNAMNIVRLSGGAEKTPFSLSVKDGKLVSKDTNGNSVMTNIIASEGNLDGVDKYYVCNIFSTLLSHLPKGNVCISMDDNVKAPIQLRNGDLSGENITAKSYIIGIYKTPVKSDEEKSPN